jgi:diadenosine tetraphosphatase ApaH/serine/threonine PP2A family protein phosphatase
MSIDRDAPDEIWCLGDLVGYGPRPNRCCALVAERADVCLIGNHDLAALGRLDLEIFSPDAAVSARWTAEALEPEARAFLEAGEPQGEREGVGLFHASPRDPVWEYVLSPGVAYAGLAATSQQLVLVGHSHVALHFRLSTTSLATAEAGTVVEFASDRWLLNPGSIGQPRDGDPRASFMTYDSDRRLVRWYRVPYPIAEEQRRIRRAELPEILADRLAVGA